MANIKNYYEIWQLKDGNAGQISEMSLQRMNDLGYDVSKMTKKENYKRVKKAKLDLTTTLDDIFKNYDQQIYVDYKGHHLMVSDVIVVCRYGLKEAFYINGYCKKGGIDFVPLTEWNDNAEYPPDIVMKVRDEYIWLSDDIAGGENLVDVTFYNKNLIVKDGMNLQMPYYCNIAYAIPYVMQALIEDYGLVLDEEDVSVLKENEYTISIDKDGFDRLNVKNAEEVA